MVLGIESSCDETAAAVLEGQGEGVRIVSSVVSSQIDLHARYGGVVPELASRAHLDRCLPVIGDALAQAGWEAGEQGGAWGGKPPIGAVAVTAGPGLVGALLVGLQVAKALARVWELPLVGVNHLSGHVEAAFLAPPPHPEFPLVALVVSGGHTSIYRADGHTRFELLGATRDDAAGEAFDKAAKMLGLGYPGGQAIERLAREGDPKAIRFPRPMPGKQDLSFSGLKTACRNAIQALEGPPAGAALANLCASYQEAIVESLWQKVAMAIRKTRLDTVLVGGGVAANGRLRELFQAEADREGIRLFIPPPALCTDNAAMIACAGYRALRTGRIDGLDLNASSQLPL